jgi:hypothetical protein
MFPGVVCKEFGPYDASDYNGNRTIPSIGLQERIPGYTSPVTANSCRTRVGQYGISVVLVTWRLGIRKVRPVTSSFFGMELKSFHSPGFKCLVSVMPQAGDYPASMRITTPNSLGVSNALR